MLVMIISLWSTEKYPTITKPFDYYGIYITFCSYNFMSYYQPNIYIG